MTNSDPKAFPLHICGVAFVVALWHVRVRPSNQMVKVFMMHFQHHKCDVQLVTRLESSLVENKGFRRCLRRDRHTLTSPPTQEKHLEPPVEFQEGLSWENSFRKPQHIQECHQCSSAAPCKSTQKHAAKPVFDFKGHSGIFWISSHFHQQSSITLQLDVICFFNAFVF